MHSWTNYILGTNRRLLQTVAFWDSRHNTYHYLVMVCLQGAAPAAHSRYIVERICFPINPPKTLGGVDQMFVEIQGVIPNPPWLECPLQAWISTETFHLIDTRIAARQSRDGAQKCVQTLSRQIKAILQEDRG